MRIFVSIALLFFARHVFADLYRWVDPESGSIKYSSYPPPWHGDPALEKGAPPVQVIPSSVSGPAAAPAVPAATSGPAAAPKPEGLAALEQRFKSLLQQFAGLPTKQDFTRAGAGFQQQMETYKALTTELDRLDPKGAERRRAQAKPLLDTLLEGLRAQFSSKPPPATQPAK